MDEGGAAEVTRGVKPDSVKNVDIVTPASIGYLARNQLAMSHVNSSLIQVRDQELREVSGLVGFGGTDVEIVQRPTFEQAGDENTFVASDSACVKIFDLRSGKAEMTIKQRCIFATPVYFSDAKFVLNKLRGGKGAMMWDLRARKPLYSLPIAANDDVAWVPTDAPSKPPILLSSTGEAYKFGMDWPHDDGGQWERKAAENAWSKLEQAGTSRGPEDDSDCCIM